jgi:hypothetical protein
MKLTFTSEAGLVSEDFSASQIINGEVIPIFFDEEGEYEKWIEGSKVSVSEAALSRQGEVTNTPTATAKPKRRRLTKNTDNDTPDSDGDSGGDVDDNSSGNATVSDGQRFIKRLLK